jgi:glycerol-3-phosphate dehydrogenase
LNTVQLARRDFLFSDHDQVQSTPEDLCTIRAQNCALFLLTYTAAAVAEAAAREQREEAAQQRREEAWRAAMQRPQSIALTLPRKIDG